MTKQTNGCVSVLCTLLAVAWCASNLSSVVGADAPRNILFITVDDMSCDSVGAFGCKLADTTPHIDGLARQGLRFKHAHVQVGNCMPSRNVMYSGRYPHNNRVEGFYQVKDPGYPVLADLMKLAGYFTGIRGKIGHSTPFNPYPGWDVVLDQKHDVHPKNVQSYYESTKIGIAASKQAKKPFCLIINISDPHKPFYGVAKQGKPFDDPNKPSRVFTADEVPVPGFLPDAPAVRKELAQYYSSVRRADDCVGAALKALQESGEQENTVVMFLSDHGMPLPFAKTQLYYHSTRTPWIVRWPGVTKPDTIDTQHMISAVDFLPTVLDIVGAESPDDLDGRSFLPVIKGAAQRDRDFVVTEYNENAGGARHPMRSVQTRQFGYLFNPWSDGKRVFKTATTGTATYRTMKALAKTDKNVAARLDLFDHRVREEFYDYENDPDALHNLIDDPDYQDEIAKHRAALEAWMNETGDHALQAFKNRDNDEAVDAYMARVEKESAERRIRKRQPKRQPKKSASKSDAGGCDDEEQQPKLPRVLLIGDSISIGYTKPVIELLKGKAEVHRVSGNAGDTGRGLERLPKWLDEKNGKWDVIHFNWGLWDLCYRNPESKTQGRRDKKNGKITHTPDQYRANLQKIVAILRKTDAKLIWASTTPVPEGEAGRKVGDDAVYNRVAAEVMKEHAIPNNDLHALMVPHMKGMTTAPGNVHFTNKGSQLLANQVVTAIEEALQGE